MFNIRLFVRSCSDQLSITFVVLYAKHDVTKNNETSDIGYRGSSLLVNNWQGRNRGLHRKE